jgi:hypothetical protein
MDRLVSVCLRLVSVRNKRVLGEAFGCLGATSV